MLLRHAAEVDRRNDRGQTPLGGVAFKGYSEIATLLLKAGADPNADNGGGCTPLFYADLFGRTEVAQILRSHGGDAGRRPLLGLIARALGHITRRFRGG